MYTAQSLDEPSFLWVETPVAHSLADASVAVVEGVVADCAQFLEEPPAANTEPCAYSFAEYSESATTSPVVFAHSFADQSVGALVPVTEA